MAVDARLTQATKRVERETGLEKAGEIEAFGEREENAGSATNGTDRWHGETARGLPA